jgi:NADP-dependent 3-hydroxy acid dehydrogenase YdfG
MPVALVTGATAGIGRAIAFALGREGYAVGVCGRSADRVSAALEMFINNSCVAEDSTH